MVYDLFLQMSIKLLIMKPRFSNIGIHTQRFESTMNHGLKRYLYLFWALSIFFITGAGYHPALGAEPHSCKGCPHVDKRKDGHKPFIVCTLTRRVQTHYPCYGCPILLGNDLSPKAHDPLPGVSDTQKLETQTFQDTGTNKTDEDESSVGVPVNDTTDHKETETVEEILEDEIGEATEREDQSSQEEPPVDVSVNDTTDDKETEAVKEIFDDEVGEATEREDEPAKEEPPVDVSVNDTTDHKETETVQEILEDEIGEVTERKDVCEHVQRVGVTILNDNLECGSLEIPAGSTVITNGFIVRTTKLVLNGAIIHNGLSGCHGMYYGKGAGSTSGSLRGTDGGPGAFSINNVPGEQVPCGAFFVGGIGNGREQAKDSLVLNDKWQVKINVSTVENLANGTIDNPFVFGGIGGGGGFWSYTDLITAGAGGGGGGIIVIIADSIEGTGLIQARGGRGGDVVSIHPGYYAGVGSGGGGGAIIIALNKRDSIPDPRIQLDVSAGTSGTLGEVPTVSDDGQIWVGCLHDK